MISLPCIPFNFSAWLHVAFSCRMWFGQVVGSRTCWSSGQVDEMCQEGLLNFGIHMARHLEWRRSGYISPNAIYFL